MIATPGREMLMQILPRGAYMVLSNVQLAAGEGGGAGQDAVEDDDDGGGIVVGG